jgi:hypothetical protein
VTRHAVLLTGGLGAGKTAVAKEVITIASAVGLHAAAIDLDWLGWTTEATGGVDDLIARNLAAIAANYVALGIDHLVLARGIVNPDGLEVVSAALPGWKLEVVRLNATTGTMEHRIRARDSGAELEEHLAQVGEIAQRVREATPSAHVVVNEQRALRDVARDVMLAAGWIDDQVLTTFDR